MGIRHLCDEKIKDEEFQYFIDNIGKFEATEKVDGSNLSIGLDSQGRLYMCRDKKDGRKLGQVLYEKRLTLGKHFAKYMEVVFDFLITHAISMSKNTEVEIEIIDQKITNVVPYDEHQIIILNVRSGSIAINKETIDTENHGTWSFKENRPYKIDHFAIQQLFQNGNSRAESLVAMKSLLLDIPSQYGANNPDSWIEGIVFRHDDLIYKLVNKDRFTTINAFLHKIRKQLSNPKPGINSTGGLFQEFMSEIADYYSCSSLATSQRKKWMEKNPNWRDHIVANDQMFFNKNLIFVKSIIGKYKKKVDEMENEYMKTYIDMFIDTPYGKCYIDEYTHKRNIDAFSSLKDRIHFVDLSVNSAAEQPKHTSIGLNAIFGGYG